MVEVFDFLPYRILQSDDVDVTSNTTVPTEFVNLILDDIGASWQAIYISVGLTLFQTIFFLTIFEIGRRNKYVESVFDRRRIRYPQRVPAPLMQQKGWCRGWLAFEWWRVRLTDEEYTKDSWDEHRQRQLEANSRQKSQSLLQNEIDDIFVKEAESHVYKTSPICAKESAKKDVESAMPESYPQPNYDDDSMEISSCEDSYSSSNSDSSSSSGGYVDVEDARKYGYGNDTKQESSNPYGYGDDSPQQDSNPYGYGEPANPYGYGDDHQASINQSAYVHGDASPKSGDNGDPYGYGDMEIENEDSSASVDSDYIRQNRAIEANTNDRSYDNGDSQAENDDSASFCGHDQQNQNVRNGQCHDDDGSCGYGDMQMEGSDSSTTYGYGKTEQTKNLNIGHQGGLEDGSHPISSEKNTEARTLQFTSGQLYESDKKDGKVEAKQKQREDEDHLKQDILAQIERVEAELEAARKATTRAEVERKNARSKAESGTDSLRSTLLTGETTPSDTRSAELNTPTASLSQKTLCHDQAKFSLDDILGNVTSPSGPRPPVEKKSSQSTTRRAFNLDEILSNVSSSKGQSSSRSSKRSAFDVNSVLRSIAPSSEATKPMSNAARQSSRETFDLDSILGNVSASTGGAKKDTTNSALNSSLSSPKSAVPPDNLMDDVSTPRKSETGDTTRSDEIATQPAFCLDNIVGNLGAVGSTAKRGATIETARSTQTPSQSSFSLDNIVGNMATPTSRSSQKQPPEKSQSVSIVPGFNVDSTMGNVSISHGPSTSCRPAAASCGSGITEKSLESLDRQGMTKDEGSKHNPKLVPMKKSDEEPYPVHKKRRGRRGSTSFESPSQESQANPVESPLSLESQANSVESAPREKSRPASQRRGRRGSTSFESGNVPTNSNSSHTLIVGLGTSSDGVVGLGTAPAGTSPVSGTPSPSRAKRCFSMGDIPYVGAESTGTLGIGESSSDHSGTSGGRRRRYPRGFSVSSTYSSDGISRLSATGASVTNYVKTHVLMINDHSEDAEDGSLGDGNFIATKVTRRKLTPEEKEQLRCIGLDAFMTLRFLKFGFDVFFWPMALSIFTLLPVYRTAAYHADVVGFFSTTIISLAFNDEFWRYWIVMVFAALHFCYILRRLWIEWEVFLPLRYDFLENGDFEKERYKEQYRKTCLVEFIPKEYKQDKSLHEFFDTLSPGEIERAEVLLNTEHLRSLIKEKMKHIVAYEDVYAKKVHLQAKYLRTLKTYQWGDGKKKRCRKGKLPQEPTEPTVRVEIKTPTLDGGKVKKEKVCSLKYHFENIQRLNREIDDEYMRLAQAQRRQVTHTHESLLSKWLGLRYVFTGQDTSRLHSSTAFVQFKTFAAKQHAIQCNITGMHKYMVVTPVPEVRDLIWDNMHVSRSLIDTRKAWANLILTGGLFLWSTIIFSIRSVNNISALIEPITESTALAAFLDVYAPALIVEGLVRMIPNLIKALCILIRFKAHSERDHYVLRWYFGYRLLTFIFLIIGGTTLIESSDELVRDPIQFIKNLAGNVASNAQFFISYVIVSGGIQVFFRLSQWHNLALFLLVHLVNKEESLSQRRLEKFEKSIKTFHLDEFIPLFLFIFMVGALYGFIAPLAGVFVAGFFLLARKVFTYMTLFIYGNHFEGGGFLFYTLSDILFYVMYMIILVVVGYFSIRGTGVQAGIFSIMLFVVIAVHRDVRNTFVEPSKTLSLAKARAFDESQDTRTLRERKYEQYTRAKKEYDAAVRKEEAEGPGDVSHLLFKRLLPRSSSGDFSLDSFESSHNNDRRSTNEKNSLEDAVQRFNDRYNGEDAFDDDDEPPVGKQSNSFFIYRQPALNRATWEVAPKPYRDSVEREEAAEVWGDERPEQTRKVARQRRASIAMYYGG